MYRVKHHRILTVGVLVSFMVVTTETKGAELQPPTPLLNGATILPVGTSPPGALTNCPSMPVSGPSASGQLVIRDTDRPDVGPYTVTLPGYGTDIRSAARDSYRPFLITASPGDTLRFDIFNQLSTSELLGGVVNLHTHGLVVSPRPCIPLGDYSFVHDLPFTTTAYRIDIPSTLPGNMYGNQSTPQPYPSGLNWFHAHIHTKSRIDVEGGQAGLIYIGDLRADLLASQNIAASTADMLSRADVLYLGLRDIQLSVPRGVTPDKAAPGTRGQWLSGDAYNSSLCPAQANPPQPQVDGEFSGPGYCGVHGSVPNAPDTVWMFTINGQYAPTITMRPGHDQIWRIANLSSSVTYVLELVDGATGKAQTMTALALDGLVAGTSKPLENALHIGVNLKHVLLMPGSRAEVFVANKAGRQARTMTLRTAGITTGPAGDPWPQIDIGSVLMQPQASTKATDSSETLADPSQVSLDVTQPNGNGAAATSSLAEDGGSSFTPPNCIVLPRSGVTRRRITFLEDGSPPTGTPRSFDFGFKTEVVKPDGQPIDSEHTIPPQAFPMQAMLAPNSVPHICPRLGTSEVWELVNTTGEIHNFHIHQSKFRLTKQADTGAPTNLVAVQDPTNIIAQYEPEVQGASPAAGVDVWHDVLPVPPALLNADGTVNTPGRVFVTIPFYAVQQVGDILFHCHILEHEDGGMMAPVQIFDPSRKTTAFESPRPTGSKRGLICGSPSTTPRATSFGKRLASEVRSLFGLDRSLDDDPVAYWQRESGSEVPH